MPPTTQVSTSQTICLWLGLPTQQVLHIWLETLNSVGNTKLCFDASSHPRWLPRLLLTELYLSIWGVLGNSSNINLTICLSFGFFNLYLALLHSLSSSSFRLAILFTLTHFLKHWFTNLRWINTLLLLPGSYLYLHLVHSLDFLGWPWFSTQCSWDVHLAQFITCK